MSESLHWIWLASRLGAASPYLNILLGKYASPKSIFEAEPSEILSLEKIPDSVRMRLNDRSLDRAERILEQCRVKGIGVMTYGDPRYPAILKTIDKPPAVLYFKGMPIDFDRRLCVSIVGTRKMSDYGRDMAYRFAYDLSSAGVNVISGMALGVDGMSAAGALDAQAHTTVVLGGGVDVVYPSVHRRLYDSILKNGLILSEYPPGAEPDRSHFPQRNRIISGLSRCTLVVESAEKGGALITAEYAVKQGRPVFAIPGALDMRYSVGTNNLIKSGAKMATSALDIIGAFEAASFSDLDSNAIGAMEYDAKRAAKRYGVASKKDDTHKVRLGKIDKDDIEEFEPAAMLGQEKEQREEQSRFVDMSPGEKAIYDTIPEEGEVSLELIVSASGQTLQDVTMHVLSLGIKGAIIELPGGRYRRA